uniref:Uncharacterized protein n=1 Tax=Rhizophora mucronata TaxID=61149 RepID=A0A2P2QMC9_RHIMU
MPRNRRTRRSRRKTQSHKFKYKCFSLRPREPRNFLLLSKGVLSNHQGSHWQSLACTLHQGLNTPWCVL